MKDYLSHVDVDYIQTQMESNIGIALNKKLEATTVQVDSFRFPRDLLPTSYIIE
jgi:hypothetical protein